MRIRWGPDALPSAARPACASPREHRTPPLRACPPRSVQEACSMPPFTSALAALLAAALTLVVAPAAPAQRAPTSGTLLSPLPKPPDFAALEATAASVKLAWTDRATDEDRFVIS